MTTKGMRPKTHREWEEHRSATEAAMAGKTGPFKLKYGYLPKAIWKKNRFRN